MLRTDGVGCHNATKLMRCYSTATVELGLDVWAGDDDGREQRAAGRLNLRMNLAGMIR